MLLGELVIVGNYKYSVLKYNTYIRVHYVILLQTHWEEMWLPTGAVSAVYELYFGDCFYWIQQ